MTRPLALSPGGLRAARDLALWGLASYGVLRLTALPGDGGAKLLCGPWGCLPPLQALAAAHGFWLLVIAPPAIWSANRLSPAGVERMGFLLATIGGVGIAATATRSAMAWGLPAPGRPWWHPVLHAAFDVAMFVDLPLVELVAGGLACVALARWRRRRGDAGRVAWTDPASTRARPDSLAHDLETRRDVRHD